VQKKENGNGGSKFTMNDPHIYNWRFHPNSNNLNQIGIESKQIKVDCWQMLPQNVGGVKGQVTCKLIKHYFLESSDGEWFSMWDNNDYWDGLPTWEIP
jgi:hypothetical protein